MIYCSNGVAYFKGADFLKDFSLFFSLGQFSLLFAAFWNQLKSLMLHAICGISELKSQIWGAKTLYIFLHSICNILAFTKFSQF